jgi:copper chaperone CopZ
MKSMEKKTIKIPNIHCRHCVHTIESEVSVMPGVVSVRADLVTKVVEIEWTQEQNWPNISALLRGLNYPPQE